MMNDQAPRFQHVQPGPSAYETVYREAIDYMNGAIRQIVSCPHLYSTKATAKELEKAAESLAILKLDDELFSNSCPKWREKFGERELVTQRQALLGLKSKFTDPGGQFLARYRTNMDYGKARCTTSKCAQAELSKLTNEEEGVGWTDTAIRAAQAWAEQELANLNNEIGPLAVAAKKRIELYEDDLDITNRYAGYRRMLGYMKKTDANDINAVKNTIETCIRPSVAPRWHLGPDWTRAKAVGTKNYTAPGDWEDCRVDKQAFLERYKYKGDPIKNAGIEVQYPGKTEYESNYLIPTFVETGMADTLPPTTHRTTFEQPKDIRGRGSLVGIDPSQVQLKGYLVNPTPNYVMEGTKSARIDPNTWKLPISEMKDNYKWPENKIQTDIFLPME